MYVQFLVDHPFLVRTGIYSGVIGSIGAGLFMWLTGRLEFKDAGYTGIFVINLVSSASVIVPVPGVAAVCGSSVPALHLNPLTLGVVGATGASLGEITGYLAGFGGQPMAARYRLYARIHDWAVRRGGVGLLLLALIPNPFFDIAGIAAGGVGYPLHKFLLYVFAGKTIRFTGIAYACRLGIDWFTRFT
jgi:membrane protein YqaA with SNARE-associated domain